MSRKASIKSTNPFDDDYDDDENDNDNVVNYSACNDGGLSRNKEDIAKKMTTILSQNSKQKRSAPLDFSNPFDSVETPALDFDQMNRQFATQQSDDERFFSPFTNALMEIAGQHSNRMVPSYAAGTAAAAAGRNQLDDDDLSYDDEQTDEISPLLPDDHQSEEYQATKSPESKKSGGGRIRTSIPKEICTIVGDSLGVANDYNQYHHHSKSSSKMKSRRSWANTNHSYNTKSIVMKELASSDNANEIMEYKYILLEDLGTASSWLILLLPYVAFLLTVFLEYATPGTIMGPINATELCATKTIHELLPPSSSKMSNATSIGPCHASFAVDNYPMDQSKQHETTTTIWTGTAFDSGILQGMPVIGTYLYGDVTFSHLSPEALALVAQGRLQSSVIVFQEIQETDAWEPLFASHSKIVSMACTKQYHDDGSFDCKSPEFFTLAFSMPESGLYEGGNLLFIVYYDNVDALQGVDDVADSHETTTRKFKNATIRTSTQITDTKSHVYAKDMDGIHSWIATAVNKDIENPSMIVEEIVASSAYTLMYKSKGTVALDTVMRILSFVISFAFIAFWFRCMGVQCCYCCHCLCKGNDEHQQLEMFWWENPWVLFPERFYIIILLLSLLLVQEPILVVVYFLPHLAADPNLHIIADTTNGVGIQGILLVYLCLFQGLKYHTADRSRRRAQHQRKALQLRRAVKFVEAKNDHPNVSSPVAVEDYYKEFGDIDGSAFTSHLRLPNDPFVDGWADFLLPKLLLWAVGVASATIAAYLRFLPSQPSLEGNVNEIFHTSDDMASIDTIYITSSLVNVLTILVWVYLIIIAIGVTGEALKREPFLGTRPAQLAYRVLFAHTALAIAALIVSFILYIRQLQSDWHGQTVEVTIEQGDKSLGGIVLGALFDVTTLFPYSGTAATVGFGRLLCVTVEVLITAFIFLPAHTMDSDDDDEGDEQTGVELRSSHKNKRDKRLVVLLGKHSHTFKIFPCPIQRLDALVSPLHDNMYQIYKDLRTDRNTHGRGLVSIGPYIPVFCAELACWLNEASWQAYYSPPGSLNMVEKDDFEGWMKLDIIGLQLEGYVVDERTNAQAYIATNVSAQVDGEEDSIIVVAFRGTSNVTHMQIDVRMRQVPILDQIAGIGHCPFRIFPDRVEIADQDGWIWNAQTEPDDDGEHVKCVACWTQHTLPCKPSPGDPLRKRQRSSSSAFEDAVSKSAKNILKAAPVARNTFPMLHEGFQDAYAQIRKQIFEILLPVLQRQVAKSLKSSGKGAASVEPLALPKIYCTGHSLGGSLAQIFALDLASNCEIILPQGPTPATHPSFYQGTEPGHAFFASSSGPTKTGKARCLQPPIGVYTFGQPRVGNKAFSRLYKQRVPHSFRVVNEGDAITAVPNFICCGGIYKHAGLEVILDEGMTGNILVGPTVVETLFRFHKVRTNIAAHQMARYRDCLECAFDSSQLLDYYQGHNVAHQELRVASRGQYNQHDNSSKNPAASHGNNSSFTKPNTHDLPDWMIARRKSTSKA